MSLLIFSAVSASAANRHALSPPVLDNSARAHGGLSHVDEQHRTSLKISGFVVTSVVNRLFSGP